MINEIEKFISEQIQARKFGEITVSIKIKDGKPVYLYKSFSEGKHLNLAKE